MIINKDTSCWTIYMFTYFNASAFTFPIACTAASLTSTTSHLNKGTVNLYKAAGLAFVPGDLLSPRSADRLSGDELREYSNFSYIKVF